MSKKTSGRSKKSGRRKSTATQFIAATATADTAPSFIRSDRPTITQSLALCDDYQITYHPAKDPKAPLIITFAGRHGHMAAQGSGTSFCLREGYDSIYVSQRHETHFQGLSLEDFEKTVRPFTADRRVICYGSSLGAYAALYYGGTVDAEILAGAPMLPSWPSLNNPRYKDFELRHLHLAETPKSRFQPTVLFDPYMAQDIHFMDEVVKKAYPDVKTVKCPYAGHTVLRTLESAGLLRGVVLDYFETGTVADIDLPTDGFAPYHLNYANCLMREGKFEEATRHGRRAFEMQRTGETISLIVRSLSRQNAQTPLLHFIEQELSDDERKKFIINVKPLYNLFQKAME